MRVGSIEILSFFLIGLAVAWEHTDEKEFRRAIGGHNHALVACKLLFAVSNYSDTTAYRTKANASMELQL